MMQKYVKESREGKAREDAKYEVEVRVAVESRSIRYAEKAGKVLQIQRIVVVRPSRVVV